MFKFLTYTGLLMSLSFQAQARRHFEDRQPPRRHSVQEWDQTIYNYFKASMGWSSLGDHRDSSGELIFEDNTILPIHLAYGFTVGNVAFEAELGFSNNEFDFISSDLSGDDGFGDLSSSKLMFNGMYKTNGAGSNLYVGGGVGWASVTLDGVEEDLTGSAIAAQFIVGGELRTTERSGIFIEYKNLKTIGLEVENYFAEVDYDFKESSINIGVKLYF